LNVEATRASVDLTVEVIKWSECLMNIAMWIIAGLLAAD
jgi:hypothetical protein